MPASRTTRRASSDRACLECQKRKTKCVVAAEGQACTFCTKASRSCVFENPQHRTPLTRRNLDAVEARCKELEARVQRLQEANEARAAVDNPLPMPRVRAISQTQSVTEDVPSAPYEWTEVLDPGGENHNSEYAQDGMASLARRGNGSGYLGTSSGYNILQSVSSLLPAQTDTTIHNVEANAPVTPNSAAGPTVGADITSYASFSTAFIHEQLITAFFLGYNSFYPILHEGTFRKQYEVRKQFSPRSSWHITYYAVLAIGEWVSGHCRDDNSIYYEMARSRLTPEILESGSLNNVQAFLLLGNYLQKRDRPNTGYNYIGIALRMAMGLGLHLELPSSSNASQFESHRRRMLFWLLYCFDSWFNITTGRPTLLSDSFVDIKIPSNIDEAQYDFSSCNVSEVAYASTCSTVIALARLTKIATRVYGQFVCANPCSDIDHQTTVLEHMIHNWHSSLPSFFFSPDVPSWFLGPRKIALWKESNLLILLFLSSQRLHNDEYEKQAMGTRCQLASANLITDVASFCQDNRDVIHCGLAWYAVYFTLQAALSYSAQYIAKHRSSTHGAQQDLQEYEHIAGQACRCLSNLSSTSNAADRSLRIVLRLREMVRRSDSSQASGDSAGISLPTGLANINVDQGQRGSLNMQTGFPGNTTQRSDEAGQLHISPNYNPDMDNQTLADLVLNEWSLAADTSLHTLFAGMDDYSGIFQGFE